MNIKKLITAGIMALAAIAASADPTVTDVVAKQRYPWNGLVDITCKVSGIDGATEWRFSVAAVMPDTGEARRVSQFWVVQNGVKLADCEVHTNGTYRLLWDAQADLGQVTYDNMVVRVTTVKGHAKVQLWEGGPYWATTNIGAEKPEDYGYYFWWGDTVGYTRSGGTWEDITYSYSGVTWVSSAGQQMSSSPFLSSSCPTYAKDNSALRSAGYIDSTGNLVPAHDAAHVHWGGNWRMPTKQELEDLNSKCDWALTVQNGVEGYLVKGKGTYASASIFLPCAGRGYEASFSGSPGSQGFYWSSVPYSDYWRDSAWNLYFCLDHGTYEFYRYFGFSVRPVQGFAE